MAFRSKKGKQDDYDAGRSKKRRGSESEDEDSRRLATASPCVSKLQGMETTGTSRPSGHDHNKPAELFRKDLISAMKLPDTEPLTSDDFYLIADSWRQEWEKGVQVPVNEETFNVPVVRTITEPSSSGDFKLPQGKMFHAVPDENYNKAVHYLTGMQQLADEVVRYDLDDLDVCWLRRINEERITMGDIEIHEWIMERVMEEFETRCHENMQQIIKTSEGLGIEYDENVICDVCRSPDSEDLNEMVFCDQCDICVHQACYGIQKIPEGSWLCRTCALGIQPQCILCPTSGGAMKGTRSGTKWTHVSCALWIPEVSIGCVEKMEPITKISNIPSSRWALVCTLCRERVGACIQCSVKTCKIAFHVTCAFQNNLEMKTILDGDEEDVKLKAYCPKHTKKFKEGLTGDSIVDISLSPRKEYTQEEKDTMRQQKIIQLQDEFYTCVKAPEVAAKLQLEEEAVDVMYQYWKLKRKVNFNRPLLTPKTEEADLLSKQQEDSLVARMKMFVHLRQDLERVRNLCYMVSRREKFRRSLYRMKEEIFYKQVEVVDNEVLTPKELQTVIQANHGEDIYDRPQHVLKMSRGVFDDSQESDHQSGDNDSMKSGHSPSKLSRFKFGIHKDRYAHLRKKNRGLMNLNRDKLGVSLSSALGVSLSSALGSSKDLERVMPCVAESVHSETDTIKDSDDVKSLDSNNSQTRRRSQRGSLDIKREAIDRTDGSNVMKAAEVENQPHVRTRTKIRNNGSLVDKILKEDRNGIIKAEFTSSSESEDVESPWPSFAITRKDSDSSFHSKSSINGVKKCYNRLSLKSRLNDHNHRRTVNGLPEKGHIKKIDDYFKLAGPSELKFCSADGSGDQSMRISPVKPTESLLKGGPNSPHKEIEKKELCESFIAGHTSPLAGYRIPRKSSSSSRKVSSPIHIATDLNLITINSPETRGAKKKLIAEIESAATDRIFERIDDDISISRSSRDTTPDKETLTRRTIKRDLMVSDFNDLHNVHRKLRKRTSSSKPASECTRSDVGSVDFENENNLNSECSATESETSGPMIRRKSRRLGPLTDEESVDSLQSSRQSSQSRETRSRLWSMQS
ncbi:protein Jade-3-like [Lineus longissimus]|uniref:protein Jade-3-like n=1 Tax=Lineus longissimus TaxID=88925 RepID=UPI00315C7A74